MASGITTDNAYTNSVELFDPITGTWSAGPDLPDNRWGGKAIVTEDNQLLLVAGRIDLDYAKDVLRFTGTGWEPVAELTTPRHYTVVAQVPLDC